MKQLGQTIKMLRVMKGLTANELAKKCGVSGTHIAHIELNQRSPSLEVLEKVSECLGVTSGILLCVADMHHPLHAPLMPMLYVSLYNSVAPAGSQWTYP